MKTPRKRRGDGWWAIEEEVGAEYEDVWSCNGDFLSRNDAVFGHLFTYFQQKKRT